MADACDALALSMADAEGATEQAESTTEQAENAAEQVESAAAQDQQQSSPAEAPMDDEAQPTKELPKLQYILERALRAKLEARQQLSEATKRHTEVDKNLMHIERQERTNARAETMITASKRARNEVEASAPSPKSARNSRRRGAEEDDEEGRVAAMDAPGEKATDSADAAKDEMAARGGDGGSRKSEEAAEAGGTKEGDAAPMDASEGAPADASEPANEPEKEEKMEEKMEEEKEGGRPAEVAVGASTGGPRSAPSPRLALDESTKRRSRKMFGVLMGTLQRARKEQSSVSAVQQVRRRPQREPDKRAICVSRRGLVTLHFARYAGEASQGRREAAHRPRATDRIPAQLPRGAEGEGSGEEG